MSARPWHDRARPRSVHPRVLAREVAADRDKLELLDQADRPMTRGDCLDGPRPCPWVSCRYHLYADVNEVTGSLKVNFPGLEPEDLENSCALDVADAGGLQLERVGGLMNITRERVRQIEVRGLIKLRRAGAGK